MKPIKEMSLAETKSKLTQSLFAIKEGNQDSWLDDAIDDAGAALDRIYELTRWIPVEERLPTEEDGKQIHVIDGFGIAFTIMQSQWDNYEPTHWRRIEKPEGA